MANVKDVEIRGTLPFDCGDNNPEMLWVLGKLNMPSEGLRITYTGPGELIPNEHGGRTAMYNYIICGQEAVADGFLVRIVNAIKGCGGTVAKATARDLENNGWSYNLLRLGGSGV